MFKQKSGQNKDFDFSPSKNPLITAGVFLTFTPQSLALTFSVLFIHGSCCRFEGVRDYLYNLKLTLKI